MHDIAQGQWGSSRMERTTLWRVHRQGKNSVMRRGGTVVQVCHLLIVMRSFISPSYFGGKVMESRRGLLLVAPASLSPPRFCYFRSSMLARQ